MSPPCEVDLVVTFLLLSLSIIFIVSGEEVEFIAFSLSFLLNLNQISTTRISIDNPINNQSEGGP